MIICGCRECVVVGVAVFHNAAHGAGIVGARRRWAIAGSRGIEAAAKLFVRVGYLDLQLRVAMS